MIDDYSRNEEVNFTEIFRIVKQYMFSIIIVSVISMMSVFYLTKFFDKPSYSSEARIMVEGEEVKNNNILMFLENDELFNEVKNNLKETNINIDRSKLNIKVIEGTNAFNIRYTDNGNNNLETIVNQFLSISITELKNHYGEFAVEPIRYASVPVVNTKLNPKLNSLIAGSVSGTIVLLYIFVKHFKENSHYTASSQRSYLDENIILSIPTVSKKKSFKSLFFNEKSKVNIPIVNGINKDNANYYSFLKANIIKNSENSTVILFTSILDDEGCSEVVISLANAFKISSEKRISLVIARERDNEDSNIIPEVFAEPVEFIALDLSENQHNIKNEIDEMKSKSDFVFISVPSLQSNYSVYELLDIVDNYYFIARQNMTNRSELVSYIKELSQLSDGFSGIILTNDTNE